MTSDVVAYFSQADYSQSVKMGSHGVTFWQGVDGEPVPTTVESRPNMLETLKKQYPDLIEAGPLAIDDQGQTIYMGNGNDIPLDKIPEKQSFGALKDYSKQVIQKKLTP